MAFKFINKLFSRRGKDTQSMIRPNDALNVANIAKYTQIIINKENNGYKGLKRAFDEKLEVQLIVLNDNGERSSVRGVISHYDEKFEQLLLITESNLKRVVFNQIDEVSFQDESKVEEQQDVEEL